jgi:hypothetical protein
MSFNLILRLKKETKLKKKEFFLLDIEIFEIQTKV